MTSNKLLFCFLIPLCYTKHLEANIVDNDGRGFIIYCPCMGRFGNQAEQLLGTLEFAKSLNRSLVLPPFINYGTNHMPRLIPFETIIQVEPIREYVDVILMKDFMQHYADNIWPDGERKFYCHSERNHQSEVKTCDAKRGQPFNTFWTSFNITEDGSIFYKPLRTSPLSATDWNENYPISSHRVIAFVGAPSPFPAREESIRLQKYIKIADNVEREATEFKKANDLVAKPYLSMHIRHGLDWKKACELLKTSDGFTQLFSSNQCTGYPFKDGRTAPKLEFDTCLPSTETIVAKLNESLVSYKRDFGTVIEVVHIATDFDDATLQKDLETTFPGLKFFTTPRDSDTLLNTMIDIYLMANSDIFIGNCISSFSAFSARTRAEQKNPRQITQYFGQDFSQYLEPRINDEL